VISVRFDCEDMECHATEDVDVYHTHLSSALKEYVPEGWRVLRSDDDGLALTLCSRHARPTHPQGTEAPD
jgi:hypothetical protein